jgi:hypothetical protein
MRKGDISLYYQRMSREDQRTFNRWLKANAILGLIFAAGIIAMALAGSRSVGPRDAAVANTSKASDVAVSAQRRKQTGVLSTHELVIQDKPF